MTTKTRTIRPHVRIAIPSHGIDARPTALAAIAQCLSPGWWDYADPITLDLAECAFISTPAILTLAMLKLHRDLIGLETLLDDTQAKSAVVKQLGRWGLTDLFGRRAYPWVDNARPLFHQRESDPDQLVEYLERQFLVGTPMSPLQRKKARKAVVELFQNAFEHADSLIGVVAAGQYYPTRRRLQLCVADQGVGLVQKVQASGHARSNPIDAVKWALAPGNTTRTTDPGGLGLSELQEIVRDNGGIFSIYANHACYSEIQGLRKPIVLDHPYPGTLVELRLRCDQDL